MQDAYELGSPAEGSPVRIRARGRAVLTNPTLNRGTAFTREQRRDFTIRKEILFESETATDAEVRAVEVAMIRELRSNDPAVGYNRWPRFRPLAEPDPPEFVVINPCSADGWLEEAG